MQLKMDSHVQKVAEFIQANVPASKLVAVSRGLAELAPVLWGSYEQEAVTVLGLRHDPITGDGSRLASSE